MTAAGTTRCWIDGQPGDRLDAADRGLHYGDGLFETLRVEAGRIRWLPLHLARLDRGAERLGIALPPRALLESELQHAAVGHGRAMLKLIVTRGSMDRRAYRPSGRERTRRILSLHDWPDEVPAPLRAFRSSVILGGTPVLAGIKHLNRLENVLAQREAAQCGADEAILSGRLGEPICGSMSNLIIGTEEGMVTPAVDQAGVEGVTRTLALAGAVALGIALRSQPSDAGLWSRMRSLYCCNVRWGLRRVATLDGRSLAEEPAVGILQAWIDAQP